jgi:hypothetical protein
MKIYISKYRHHWISPYTIFDRMFFWTDWSKCSRWTLTETLEDEQREKSTYVDHPEWVDRWADRLTPISGFINRVLDWIHPRIEYVRIDPWDTWSMDHTLAAIVLPMLRQLQATKHGSPNVDDEDVPENLRSTVAPPKENEWDIDSNHHARWDWVLEEMIFAFEMKARNDWESAFHSGEIDMRWVPVDAEGNEVPKGEHRHYRMERGPADTHVYDAEGAQQVQARISNGFRLFGRYYESLWD